MNKFYSKALNVDGMRVSINLLNQGGEDDEMMAMLYGTIKTMQRIGEREKRLPPEVTEANEVILDALVRGKNCLSYLFAVHPELAVYLCGALIHIHDITTEALQSGDASEGVVKAATRHEKMQAEVLKDIFGIEV